VSARDDRPRQRRTAAASFTAIARDLSINGIGLLKRGRPPRNARMIVQLPRP
jgi:hypothetical protein